MDEYEEVYNENYQTDEKVDERPSTPFNWDDYEHRLKFRPKIRAKTYLEEILEPYLRCLKWVNETFNDDMTALMIGANFYWKRHSPAQFKEILEWAKKKDSLHPRQLTKLFYKK